MRVQDSQEHRNMNVTRERISCILELREILLSFHLVSTLPMLLLSVYNIYVYAIIEGGFFVVVFFEFELFRAQPCRFALYQ